jgi:hypothetical protein
MASLTLEDDLCPLATAQPLVKQEAAQVAQ